MKAFFFTSVLVGSAILFLTLARSEVWTETAAPFGNYHKVRSSADGGLLVAVGGRGIFVSTNYGSTWSSNGLVATAVAVAADGSNVVVGGSLPGAIYTSADAGLAWTTQSFSFGNVTTIASSTDCRKLAAGVSGNSPIITSADYGVTWTTNNNTPAESWIGIASSADGSRLWPLPKAILNCGFLQIQASHGRQCPESAPTL